MNPVIWELDPSSKPFFLKGRTRIFNHGYHRRSCTYTNIPVRLSPFNPNHIWEWGEASWAVWHKFSAKCLFSPIYHCFNEKKVLILPDPFFFLSSKFLGLILYRSTRFGDDVFRPSWFWQLQAVIWIQIDCNVKGQVRIRFPLRRIHNALSIIDNSNGLIMSCTLK